MNEMKLNDTPVRTSQNYQINDITLNDICFNQNETFDNIIYQDFDSENLMLTEETDDFNLVYGLSKELEQKVKANSNVSLKIELKGKSEKENSIHFIFNDKNKQLLDDIEIIVDENSKGKITIQYEVENKDGQYAGVHNGILRTTLKSNAELTLTVINLTGYHTNHLMAIENILEEKSKLYYQIVDFGGKSSVTNYYTNLKGDYAENTLNTIYLGIQEQKLDMNYIAETRGKYTKMNIDVQGALKDTAKKHFKGTIDFKRGGKKSEGSENEFCMLLSDEAKSISLPMLLCDEEDVIGNHATAAGKMNNKELFYLMSRGLSEKEAKILLVRAKFNKVIEQLSDERLKNEVLAEIDERLA